MDGAQGSEASRELVRVMTPLPPDSCKVYTPPALAEALVATLGDKPDAQWLEPCVGRGVFLQALHSAGVTAQRIRGMDIDPIPAQADSRAQVIRGCDFFHWAIETRERFDRIVANPPYVSFRRLPLALREVALQVPQPGGGRIAANANCWLAFLCAALRVLRRGGALGFVLPAAWEYADYAQPLRKYFLESFDNVEVHRCLRPLFEPVQEGSVVLVARGYLGHCTSCHRYQHATAQELVSALRKRKEAVPLGQSLVAAQKQCSPARTCLLAEIMEVRLGGVTGDAGYFLLTEKQRQEHRLPIASLRPVLSKAQHLVGSELTSELWCTLRDTGARVWLFRPPRLLLTHRSVVSYLELGKCRPAGHKVSRRTPWYLTPLPRSCDGFISGMSSAGPWIALRVMPRLIATNTLYTIRFRKRYSLEERAAWALALLTSEVRAQWQEARRIYAAGLPKLEPGDLNRLMLPKPARASGAREALCEATDALLNRDAYSASWIADCWFLGQKR